MKKIISIFVVFIVLMQIIPSVSATITTWYVDKLDVEYRMKSDVLINLISRKNSKLSGNEKKVFQNNIIAILNRYKNKPESKNLALHILSSLSIVFKNQAVTTSKIPDNVSIWSPAFDTPSLSVPLDIGYGTKSFIFKPDPKAKSGRFVTPTQHGFNLFFSISYTPGGEPIDNRYCYAKISWVWALNWAYLGWENIKWKCWLEKDKQYYFNIKLEAKNGKTKELCNTGHCKISDFNINTYY